MASLGPPGLLHLHLTGAAGRLCAKRQHCERHTPLEEPLDLYRFTLVISHSKQTLEQSISNAEIDYSIARINTADRISTMKCASCSCAVEGLPWSTMQCTADPEIFNHTPGRCVTGLPTPDPGSCSGCYSELPHLEVAQLQLVIDGVAPTRLLLSQSHLGTVGTGGLRTTSVFARRYPS